MTKVSFACRSIGMPCEWAVQVDSVAELLPRVADHAKCAHKIAEIDPALRARIEAALA